jgi:hypothetical protein
MDEWTLARWAAPLIFFLGVERLGALLLKKEQSICHLL